MGLNLKNTEIYKPSDINRVLNNFQDLITVKKKKVEYYNIPCSFDIETSSFYRDKGEEQEKVAIMYEWTLCLNGYVIIGRTWEQFNYVYYKIVNYFGLYEDLRLIIYVHNLSFEFQFMRKRFDWLKVFSLEKRKPIQAITMDGVEFRCSYLLSGYSLANLSNQLNKYKVEKMVGDLDYSKIRHSKTPLTDKEIKYCINDTLVVVAYIQETIERVGDISKIPLTKTGFVREYCRNMCLYDGDNDFHDKFKKYRKIMKNLTIDEDTYLQLKRAFAGGFTHANPFYSGKIMDNVSSFDFTSSYPYVMISEQFPMSEPELIEIHSLEEFQYNLDHYCCLFDLELDNVYSIRLYENYISTSHCKNLRKPIEDNGRIVNAEHLEITITEQDYFIIDAFYDWDEMCIKNFRRFKRDYLPRDFVMSILKMYVDKTTLKDIPEKVIEYMQSKERINACYGMTVTDICRDEIVYSNDWFNENVDIEKALESYNKSIKRFLYYPWGVWVTAYARVNLFTGIMEFEDDYIYSDTDSIKVLNIENHMDYINKYNEFVLKKLDKAMWQQGLDIELTRPKNIKGKEKQIGIWDFEGTYTRFKTLGAKRYMVEKNGKISLTVSGVNKTKAVNYLEKKYKTNTNIFNHFNDGLIIPKEDTGKMIHTYIDEELSGYITDYLGNTAYYEEYSGTHLENAEYSLSLADAYVEYLLGIKEYEK